MLRLRRWHRPAMVSAPIIAALGLYGCPQGQTQALSKHATTEVHSPSLVQPVATTVSPRQPETVAFTVCAHLPDWQRPNAALQTAALNDQPRYGGEQIDQVPMNSLSEKFWHGSVITFTTYGLSARMEPLYLSGVWTAMEAIDPCYEGDFPVAINQNQSAELWLIGYRLTDIQWSGDQYQVSVEAVSRGLQVIQFERTESESTLPVVVITSDGSTLEVASGDW